MKKFKLLIINLFLLIICHDAYSQKQKNWTLPSECLYTEFNAIINKHGHSLPFSKIILSDTRFDTSKFGYIYEYKWAKDYRLCLKKNLKDEATFFLNNFFSPNFSQTDDEVFACIRNISNRVIVPEKKVTLKDKKNLVYNFCLKIEFYLKKGSTYYPLYRFDSTLTYQWNSKEELSEQISTAFIASTQRLSDLSIYKISKLKSLTYHEIDSFNNISRNIPLLKQASPQRGIYLTLNQFKENKPSYTNFEISSSEAADLLYVKGKNLEDSVISDAWAFSDGKKMFIRIGYNFFPLYKVGDNFEFYGHPNISTNKPFAINSANPYHPTMQGAGIAGAAIELGISGLMSLIKTTTKDLQPYVLDMEEGKIYQSFAIFY
jgi:hypothetical protein